MPAKKNLIIQRYGRIMGQRPPKSTNPNRFNFLKAETSGSNQAPRVKSNLTETPRQNISQNSALSTTEQRPSSTNTVSTILQPRMFAVQYTDQDRVKHVLQWKASGLTFEAYCKACNLNPEDFELWVKESEKVEGWQGKMTPLSRQKKLEPFTPQTFESERFSLPLSLPKPKKNSGFKISITKAKRKQREKAEREKAALNRCGKNYDELVLRHTVHSIDCMMQSVELNSSQSALVFATPERPDAEFQNLWTHFQPEDLQNISIEQIINYQAPTVVNTLDLQDTPPPVAANNEIENIVNYLMDVNNHEVAPQVQTESAPLHLASVNIPSPDNNNEATIIDTLTQMHEEQSSINNLIENAINDFDRQDMDLRNVENFLNE